MTKDVFQRVWFTLTAFIYVAIMIAFSSSINKVTYLKWTGYAIVDVVVSLYLIRSGLVDFLFKDEKEETDQNEEEENNLFV